MRQCKVARKLLQGNNVLEQLEGRRLLSTTLDAGVLRILGTEYHDQVSVVEINGLIEVNENGTTYRFSRSAVEKITFDGGFGGDKFEMQSDLAIPLEAFGGIGRDTIVGGAASDTIWGGKGGDQIIGNNGEDVIRAALGDDRIIAGGKLDTIYGGEGNDTVNSGAADDLIIDSIGTNAVDSGAATLERPLSIRQAYLSNVTGYDPNQIRRAYQYGEYDPNAGAGQTIYIVNAFTGRDVLGDFQTFSRQFDLPLPILGQNFEIVNASGRTPAVDAGWAGEIALDLQWAHAMAPGAKIVLVQADSNLFTDITDAIRVAAQMSERNGGGIVSMSLGSQFDDFLAPGYQLRENVFRTNPNTTFIAASGDFGGFRSYPSTSPFVTSVGGTSLFVDQEGTRNGEESAWAEGGGGFTANFAAPAYQRPLGFTSRATPDVAYNADPATGFAVFLTTPQNGDRGWFTFGGTSAGAPQWAAIVARINQARQAAGQAPVGGNLNGMMYQLYHDGVAYDDPYIDLGINEGGFTDILTGAAGVNPAFVGYDLATGIGTPNVSRLVAQLQNFRSFYFSDTFEFEAQFFLPLDTPLGDSQPILPLTWPQSRSGSGTISGGETVVLDFVTVPNIWQDPQGESAFDLYDVELYRTQDGRIYGTGAALINNVNSVGPFSVTFVLDFEGTWTQDANGEVSVDIDFEAVDPVTFQPIPKSQFARSALDPNYGGTWFGGSINS